MNWSSVASNQTVSWNSLKNAIDNGIFTQLASPIPPSGVSEFRCIRKDLIQSYIDIESGPLVGVPDNELVTKSQLIASPTTYYRLLSCRGSADAWTKIVPVLTLQRYRLPEFPSDHIYTYSGFSQTSFQPTGYNGAIVIVSGLSGCV